jgi:hypothetical protein
VGDLEPLRLEDLVSMLSEAGGLRARTVRLPAALITGAGLLGSTLQRLGWRRVALTADKGRELLARHWTSHTASSLEALGVDELMPFNLGAASTWSWYRYRGWVG